MESSHRGHKAHCVPCEQRSTAQLTEILYRGDFIEASHPARLEGVDPYWHGEGRSRKEIAVAVTVAFISTLDQKEWNWAKPQEKGLPKFPVKHCFEQGTTS